MNLLSKLRLSVVVLVSMVTLALSSRAADLVPFGSQWKYVLGTNEASLPDTAAWRSRTFDDIAWQTGITPLGYPSAGATGI